MDNFVISVEGMDNLVFSYANNMDEKLTNAYENCQNVDEHKVDMAHVHFNLTLSYNII